MVREISSAMFRSGVIEGEFSLNIVSSKLCHPTFSFAPQEALSEPPVSLRRYFGQNAAISCPDAYPELKLAAQIPRATAINIPSARTPILTSSHKSIIAFN
jgi:hypothetical protein